MKLTIYLLLGSAFMLVGVVAVYLQAFPAGMRTFDMQALAAVTERAVQYRIPDFCILSALAGLWFSFVHVPVP